MKRKYVEIELLPDGTMKVEAFGFSGNACERAIEEVMEQLGAEVSEAHHKPEYYERVSMQQRKQSQGA